jgi:3-isopropylmalate/(R)-2-methylmalate dehydratase small subunit
MSPEMNLASSPDLTLHRVWQLGADIDTDVLAPGHAMKYGIATIARHCLESVRPEFAAQVQRGDVVVAGPNFGIGSSREQAASVLVELGVAAVISPSFSGLYFRNAFNVGLLLLTCDQAQTLQMSEHIALDGEGRFVQAQDGRRLACEPIPDFLMQMVRNGGLLPTLRQRLAREHAAATSTSTQSTTRSPAP